MKREEVREIFPNATDEEVTNILNKFGEELNPLKKRATDAEGERDKAQADLAKAQADAAGYKSQLDDANAKIEENMTAEERIAALEKAATEREEAFNLKSNGLDAKEIFVGAGCFEPEEIAKLVEQVTTPDADQTKANAQLIVDTVAKQREAVDKAVRDELMKSNPKPKGGGGKEGAPESMQDFLKLPYDQQLALKEANPDILSQLK